MLYLTFILSIILFAWVLVIMCKVIKRSSSMRKNPNQTRVLLTRNEELYLVWLLISYLLIVGNGLCYGMIFDQSDFVKLDSAVFKEIVRIYLYVMLVPPNSTLIIATVFVICMNKKIRATIESDLVKHKINQSRILVTFWAYFIAAVICAVCYKVDIISDGAFFSILTYCKVIVLGLMVIVLRTPVRLSDGSEDVA